MQGATYLGDANSYPENLLNGIGIGSGDISDAIIWNLRAVIASDVFSQRQRQVLRLYYVRGWEPEFIASRIGKPKCYVERELARIRHILKKNKLNICLGLPEPQKQKIFLTGELEIEELGFSVRVYCCLRRAGVETVGDIVEMGRDGLAKVRNMGKKSIDEVVTKLEKLYIRL